MREEVRTLRCCVAGGVLVLAFVLCLQPLALTEFRADDGDLGSREGGGVELWAPLAL